MELIELHVGELSAGLCGQGDAVAGGHGGVGGVAVDLARSAGGDEDSARADPLQNALRAAFAVEQVGPDHAAICDDQAGDRGPFGKTNALVDAGKGGQRAADLGAGGVAVGVQDAGQGVRAFAGAQQFARFGIEGRAPLDQLGHAHRPFGHQRLGGGTIDQPVAGVDGVIEMQCNVRIAFHGHGDAALRIMGVGLGNGLLGDHQNLAVTGQFDGRAQPGHARSHHQKIDLRRNCHKGLGYHRRHGAGSRE